MKNFLKISSLVCLLFLAFACSKDDDPADSDIFVGTYKGEVSYSSDDESTSNDDGKITVVKMGSKKYDFHFSDGIPDLTGVEFKEDGDNTLINVDLEEGITYIKIDESTLNIFYTKDDEVWKANTER